MHSRCADTLGDALDVERPHRKAEALADDGKIGRPHAERGDLLGTREQLRGSSLQRDPSLLEHDPAVRAGQRLDVVLGDD